MSHFVIAQIDGGLRLAIDPADRGAGLHIRLGRYELNELDFVRSSVREGQHVLDVGAHVGLYTINLARAVGPAGSVHAFEPLAESADCLEESVRQNGFEARVHVVRQAVGDRRRSAALVFAEEWANPGAAFIEPADSRLPPGHQSRPVEMVALDDLRLPRPISFIKVDVEGMEAEVLQGARRLLREDLPLVLSELHPRPRGSDPAVVDAVAMMRGIGYRCHHLGAGVTGEEVEVAPSRGIASVVFAYGGQISIF